MSGSIFQMDDEESPVIERPIQPRKRLVMIAQGWIHGCNVVGPDVLLLPLVFDSGKQVTGISFAARQCVRACQFPERRGVVLIQPDGRLEVCNGGREFALLFARHL